jgi:hypothetical protein
LEGAIPSTANFMDVVTEYDSVADAASALENHRGSLLERETALQRWSVALELEVTTTSVAGYTCLPTKASFIVL